MPLYEEPLRVNTNPEEQKQQKQEPDSEEQKQEPAAVCGVSRLNVQSTSCITMFDEECTAQFGPHEELE